MTDRLALHLTTWKWWYALAAVPAFLLGGMVPALGSMLGGDDPDSALAALLIPLSFVTFAVTALGLIALLARRLPTAADLGLRRGLSGRDVAVVAVVFIVSHALFFLLGLGTDASTTEQARAHFDEQALGGPLAPTVAVVVSSVILAPVCEELLYRGAVLRPVHDGLVRRGAAAWIGAALGIAASTVLFALPHLGGSLTGAEAMAYLVTGAAFGLVYVLTGSMTAAMVSHALQSWFTYGQILIFGRDGAEVSPVVWVLVLGCPLWVYLCSQALRLVLPSGR